MKPKKETDHRIKHQQDYVAFLQKRIDSVNFKNNVSKEEFEVTKIKLKKAKLVLEILTKIVNR